MKFKPSIKIKNYDGKTIAKSSDDKEPITLQDVLITACVNANSQDVKTGEDKMKVYRILQKVYKHDKELELDAEEITLLKTLVAGIYAVTVVGPVFDLLEQK